MKSSNPLGYFSDIRFISSFALGHVSSVSKDVKAATHRLRNLLEFGNKAETRIS